MAGITVYECIHLKINDEYVMVWRDNISVGCAPDTNNGFCKFLFAEGIIQAFRSSCEGLNFAVHSVVVGEEIKEIVFVDYQVEAPCLVAKCLIEISHEKYLSSCIVMSRKEHIEVFYKSFLWFWFGISCLRQ